MKTIKIKSYTVPETVHAGGAAVASLAAIVGPLDTPHAVAAEWLLTDGRGGFAMGTAAGVPTRRYHALFIAALRPPVGRTAMLNATVDRLVVNPGGVTALAVDLSSFQFAGQSTRLHPDGASRAVRFEKGADGTARWVYEWPGVRVTKTVHVHRDVVGVTLEYVVERLPGGTPGSQRATPPLGLTVRPLVSLRDFHGLIRRAWADRFAVAPTADGRSCRVEREGVALWMKSEAGEFTHDPQWWLDFLYTEDAARGQDCVEDLFSPGEFVLSLAAGQVRAEMRLRASIDDLPAPSGRETQAGAELRQDRLAHAATFAQGLAPALPADLCTAVAALTAAADDFVVARSPSGISVIAGYPWFSDWGRDTFISLPGLMLATGRFDEARATLLAFASRRRRGLIPNMFNDGSGEAEYNTADASLWFIHAACAFLDASADRAGWTEHLAPACADIVGHYRRGTDFNIAMDPFDKLVTAGTAATQLTWMDARRDGVVFTPRHGKAVEINALWVSGLKRLSAAVAPDDPEQAANLNDLGEAAAASFRRRFWNEPANCLFDCLTPSDSERGPAAWVPDGSIRPNQLFAVSLPHSPLSTDQQRAVVACVKARLWTPCGVRTLDPADPRYRGRYEGNLFERDRAYHQGTAWPWLLGPLAEATLRVGGFSGAARVEAAAIIRPLLDLLQGSGPKLGAARAGALGHVAEVFDGDNPPPPQRAEGCPAQAWSVAELLRLLLFIGA